MLQTNLDEQFTIHALVSEFQKIQESKFLGFPLIADQATKAPTRTQLKKVQIQQEHLRKNRSQLRDVIHSIEQARKAELFQRDITSQPRQNPSPAGGFGSH